MLHLYPIRHGRVLLTVFFCLALAAGISACGKRGDPYRPAEISASS